MDVFLDGKKTMDQFSRLKSNNYLVYAMSALYAKKNNLTDCFILNNQDRICDSTIANVFCIKDQMIFTPPLSEGCISGVMRRYLIDQLKISGYSITEKPFEIEWLRSSDEIFLSNAISGIRWVQSWADKSFTHQMCSEIFDAIIKKIP